MNETISRRDFLRHLTLAGAVTLRPLVSLGAPPAYIPIGKAGAFKAGQWTKVLLPNKECIYVRRLPGRKPAFQAVDVRCTHKGCPVAWTPTAHQFICPCHNGRYDANGKNIAGPPPAPLRSLPVKVQKGIISVQPPQ